MFVPCHCHDERSNFRGRDALVRTTELIDYAHELGHKGVAITNHETISSSLKANKYITSKMSEEDWKDFKVINGNEIYLCKDVPEGEKPSIFPHFLLPTFLLFPPRFHLSTIAIALTLCCSLDFSV